MTANVVPISAAQSHDASAALEALAIIFGDRPRQLSALDPATGAETSAVFAPHDHQGVTAWLAEHAACNIYFGHAERKPGATQRRKVDIAAVHWLHVDIDPCPGEPLDAERQRIRALIENPPEGIPKPSLVFDSGRGFVASWQLAEPLRDLAAAEAANRWLAEQLGGDKCHDVSRILRLPGTVNHKPEAQGRRARIVSHHAGAVYTFDRFGRSERRERQEPDATPIGGELDRPEDIAAGIAICLSAAPAIEGQAGRTAAFTVGMLLKRSGVSLERAQDLAVEHYDPRCSPPDEDWIRERIERGWLDGEGRPGCDRPEVLAANAFAGVVVPEPVYMNGGGTTSTSSALPVLDLSALGLQHAPERLWAVDGMMPLLKATLLTGRGGVGKSLLAQLLATCTAVGVPFLGMRTRQATAAYISWEDDAEELWRRQEAICAIMGVPLADLGGKLHLISMTEQPDSLLVTFDAAGNRTVTSRGLQVEAFAVDHALGFLALDNASHLMGGDHNAVKDVAGFAHWLNKLAQRIGGAVMLLHHPNKSGDDWLGSVAYENQFRSRLFMDRPADAVDPDMRVLTNPKANYARSGGEVHFRWYRGTFLRDTDLPADAIAAIVETTEAVHDNEVFLTCLAERNRQLRPVSERFAPNYAPKVFADMAESKGIGKKRLQAAMDRLFKTGIIARSVIGWDTVKRRPLEGVREVEGAAPNPQSAPNPRTKPAPDPAPNGAPDLHQTPHQTAPNTHPYTYGIAEGAAPMVAALPHDGVAPPTPASLF